MKKYSQRCQKYGAFTAAAVAAAVAVVTIAPVAVEYRECAYGIHGQEWYT